VGRLKKANKIVLFIFAITSLSIVYLFVIAGLGIFLFYPMDSSNVGPTYEGWYYALFTLISLILYAPRVIRYLYNEIVSNNKPS
jgi:hypothetical protein